MHAQILGIDLPQTSAIVSVSFVSLQQIQCSLSIVITLELA